jgi:hypothetical protein
LAHLLAELLVPVLVALLALLAHLLAELLVPVLVALLALLAQVLEVEFELLPASLLLADLLQVLAYLYYRPLFFTPLLFMIHIIKSYPISPEK